MINYNQLRQSMISGQILPHKITCFSLINTLSLIPRENFVSVSQASLSYSDQTLEIFKNRYLLAPMIFGRLLQEAQIQKDHKVLDIGFGTGYSSLVLGHMAAHVIGLENHRSLVTRLKNLKTEQYPQISLQSVYGPLEKGCLSEAPYDAIIIEGAVSSIPSLLIPQLKEGGRLIMMLQEPGKPFCQATILIKRGESRSLFHPFEAAVPLLQEFQSRSEFKL